MKISLPAIAGFTSILLLSGCSRQYDVLNKIADSTTIGESIAETIQDKISKESGNIEYIFRSINSNSDDKDDKADAEALGERPEYDALQYIDVSKCDISKVTCNDIKPVSDKDIDEAIRNKMFSQQVYDGTNISRTGDIVSINYTATEKGKNKPYVNVENEDRVVGDNMFPSEIDKMLIGVKAGDEIDTEYSYPSDYLDNTYKDKTFIYHIKINEVKGMTLTDAVAESISGGAVKTAKDYREYAKAMLQSKYVDDSCVDKLCEMCVVKSYPEDVLEYDIQKLFVDFYQTSKIEGTSIEDIEKSVKDYGYNTLEDFTQEIQNVATSNLNNEMKVLALAEKYDVMPADANNPYERYVAARTNLAKEIQEYGR